jgi:ABC-2 type transport system ATP-binding protein
MRQRAMIARALLNDPDVILLDEPTRALDPVHTAEIQDLIKHKLVAQEGKTVLIATNVLDEAWRMCDRVALLNAGRLMGFDTPNRLRERVTAMARYRVQCHPIDDKLIERVLASARCAVEPDAEGIVVDVEPDPSDFTSVLRALVANGVRVSSISREEPPPNAFFMRGLYRG